MDMETKKDIKGACVEWCADNLVTILAENQRRKAAEEVDYDPISGLNATGRRVKVKNPLTLLNIYHPLHHWPFKNVLRILQITFIYYVIQNFHNIYYTPPRSIDKPNNLCYNVIIPCGSRFVFVWIKFLLLLRP